MWFVDDLQNSSGHWYVYELDEAPGTISAVGTGATADASASDATVDVGTAGFASGDGAEATTEAAEGEALGYAVVTLVEPLNLGPGSILYPAHFDGTPSAGDTVRHPTTGGLQILPDGTIIFDEYGEYVCYYDDGTGEVEFTITLDDSARVFADGVTATAEASDADLYGGVNVSGAGVTDTATAAQGGATVGTIASGSGATATTEASSASAVGPANVSGEGVSVDAETAEGVGEIVELASGEGVTAEAIAAQATVEGDVQASGAGVTATAVTAEARATGDLLPGSIPYAALTVVYPRTLLIARAAA